MKREAIFEYVKKQYSTEPEYLWMKWPEYAVLRHADNNKWYAIIMNVSRATLGLDGDSDEVIDILDVKCDSTAIDFFRQMDGFLPAYHMSKTNWITILLDGSVADEKIKDFIDASFQMTAR